MISVTGKIVQWFVFDLYFFLGEFAAHITGMNQLFLDLCKILLTECDIQSSADGFQVCDVFFCFFGQRG